MAVKQQLKLQQVPPMRPGAGATSERTPPGRNRLATVAKASPALAAQSRLRMQRTQRTQRTQSQPAHPPPASAAFALRSSPRRAE
jgi:hypothetical protein